MSGAVGDQHPIAAGPSLSRSGYPLLDDSAAQIGVDKPCPRDRLAQAGIANRSPRANEVNHRVLNIRNRNPPHHSSTCYSTMKYRLPQFSGLFRTSPYRLPWPPKRQIAQQTSLCPAIWALTQTEGHWRRKHEYDDQKRGSEDLQGFMFRSPRSATYGPR